MNETLTGWVVKRMPDARAAGWVVRMRLGVVRVTMSSVLHPSFLVALLGPQIVVALALECMAGGVDSSGGGSEQVVASSLQAGEAVASPLQAGGAVDRWQPVAPGRFGCGSSEAWAEWTWAVFACSCCLLPYKDAVHLHPACQAQHSSLRHHLELAAV
eukprot:CAMPEP_0119303792 /NCGR_PEP_ID=MMETSP1333-20130426/5172_1 /TAXON_ID=418940 /ORGANISM="Scyphosphaera apsteinii, Strain RCC1455" /LENGTH=157 /DNA_ID=CAMNT_0007306553 /DNA_START=339 /DNA_END=809 /DNA_ORIENTATION=-